MSRVLIAAILTLTATSVLAPTPPRPFIRQMLTSYYGEGFHGRLTASGTRFNRWAMTAAHKRLPFGTRLRLTYPKTHRSVVVALTDRGPYVGKRELDVSQGVARRLGFEQAGVVQLWVEVLGGD